MYILPLGKEEIKPFTSALANNRLRASITKINKKHGREGVSFP
jgi:hypothetical protein